MILAHYDTETGAIQGMYDTDFSYLGGIPSPTIEITKEQHRAYGEMGQRHKVLPDKKTGAPTFTYVEPPTPTLAEEKARAWDKIKAQRDSRELAGFPYKGKQLDSDEKSAQRIGIAVQAATAAKLAGVAFALEWTTADNTTLALDADGFIGMPVALAQYSNSLHVIARQLREQIEAATTIEAVKAIAWPAE